MKNTTHTVDGFSSLLKKVKNSVVLEMLAMQKFLLSFNRTNYQNNNYAVLPVRAINNASKFLAKNR